MRKLLSATLLSLSVLPSVGLTGCFSTVRQVRKVQAAAPGSYRTATVEELEKEIQTRDEAIKTLNATVELTATTGGGREGKEKTFTTVRGFIVVRKPHDLRVILQAPYVGSKAADMVGDENTFKLLIPFYSKAYVGSNEVTQPSPNTLENLRPPVFFDALLIPGVDKDDYVTVTSTSRLVEQSKHAMHANEELLYDLTYLHVKTGKLLAPERVVRISRTTLLPISQDVYDAKGQVVTHTTYDDYQPSPEIHAPFPRLITITRPLDELNLKITVTKLTFNEDVPDDQFELKIPPSYKVQEMK